MTKEEELQDIRETLADYRAARRALALGKSYQIGSRTLTRLNYNEIRLAIHDLEIELANLEQGATSCMRITVGIPTRG